MFRNQVKTTKKKHIRNKQIKKTQNANPYQKHKYTIKPKKQKPQTYVKKSRIKHHLASLIVGDHPYIDVVI